MSAPVAAKGWCPGALRPMESGDGLIARIRPRGGRLSAAAAAVGTRARILEWRLDRFRPDLEDVSDHRDAVLAALPRL